MPTKYWLITYIYVLCCIYDDMYSMNSFSKLLFPLTIAGGISCQSLQDNHDMHDVSPTQQIIHDDIENSLTWVLSITDELSEELKALLGTEESKLLITLVDNYRKWLFSNVTILGKVYYSSGWWITIDWLPWMKQIDYFLVQENILPGQLWRAIPWDDKGTIILSYPDIENYLIQQCATELWLSLTIQEAIAIVFYEESNHLRLGYGELENDLFVIKTLPEKYSLIKLYAMCRSYFYIQDHPKRQPNKAYQKSFEYYKKLMNNHNIETLHELNINTLKTMRDDIINLWNK